MNSKIADKLIDEHKAIVKNDVNLYLMSERAKYRFGFYIILIVCIVELIAIINLI